MEGMVSPSVNSHLQTLIMQMMCLSLLSCCSFLYSWGFTGRNHPSGIGSELAEDDGSSLRLCELQSPYIMSNTWMSLSTSGPWSIRHAAMNQTFVDDSNCHEKYRLSSLEITHHNSHQTSSIWCINITDNAWWVGVLLVWMGRRMCKPNTVCAPTGALEKTSRATALHLAQKHQRWPDLVWHGAAGGKRCSSELTFLENAGFVWRYTPIVWCMLILDWSVGLGQYYQRY